MKVTFSEYKEYMQGDGYAEREITRIFRAFKAMDGQSRSWLVWWIVARRLPKDEIEGITARYLIEERGFKPVNAFIIMDWLKTEPETAKYFLLKTETDANIGEKAVRELEKLMPAVQTQSAPGSSEPEADESLGDS